MQCFFVFNRLNHSAAGAKNFRCLEPELEIKFQLHNPGSNNCKPCPGFYLQVF